MSLRRYTKHLHTDVYQLSQFDIRHFEANKEGFMDQHVSILDHQKLKHTIIVMEGTQILVQLCIKRCQLVERTIKDLANDHDIIAIRGPVARIENGKIEVSQNEQNGIYIPLSDLETQYEKLYLYF